MPQHLSYWRGAGKFIFKDMKEIEIHDYDTHTFLDHEFQNINQLISKNNILLKIRFSTFIQTSENMH